jgi:prophage antirepressor-like protein
LRHAFDEHELRRLLSISDTERVAIRLLPRQSKLTTFAYLNNSVRVVEIDGQPWFVAADVCAVLGLSNTTVAIGGLASDEKTKFNLGLPGRHPAIISESGLYKLVMRSDKPAARKFQDWVTRDVLPAIRKDGMYVAGEEKVATDAANTPTHRAYGNTTRLR